MQTSLTRLKITTRGFGVLGPGAAVLAAAGAVRGPEEGRSCRSSEPLLLPAWGRAGPGARLQLQLLRLQKQVGPLGRASKTQLGKVKKETCSVPPHLGRADPAAKLPAINTASPQLRVGLVKRRGSKCMLEIFFFFLSFFLSLVAQPNQINYFKNAAL